MIQFFFFKNSEITKKNVCTWMFLNFHDCHFFGHIFKIVIKEILKLCKSWPSESYLSFRFFKNNSYFSKTWIAWLFNQFCGFFFLNNPLRTYLDLYLFKKWFLRSRYNMIPIIKKSIIDIIKCYSRNNESCKAVELSIQIVKNLSSTDIQQNINFPIFGNR